MIAPPSAPLTASTSAIVPEIRVLGPQLVEPLAHMLEALDRAGERAWFAPHPFERAHLHRLAAAPRGNLYHLLVAEGSVLAYGLLRGWDEGFEVPSLGIAVDREWRGRGLGIMMMHFLHGAARLRRAPRVRLRVARTNARAIALYRRMGYCFEPDDGLEGDGHEGGGHEGLVTGFKELGQELGQELGRELGRALGEA